MSTNRHIQEQIHRLATLRKYQAYYGPNTPYQIVAEINQLEAELRRMLEADLTRPTESFNPTLHQPQKVQQQPGGAVRRRPVKKAPFWRMSQATIDIIATIAFIGLVFLLGSIVFAAYVHSQAKDNSESGGSYLGDLALQAAPTLRPTFTPTLDPNAPPPEPAQEVAPEADAIAIAAAAAAETGGSLLPAPVKEPTAIPTAVPTLTPSAAPSPTFTPSPTVTPVPTEPPPPPPPRPVAPTPTPGPPTATPGPSYPFRMSEMGNRAFQQTNYHVITMYIAVTTDNNVPVGGLKVVGDHVPSGMHSESGLSDWSWSVVNCLDCDYIKFGNLKFEPGTFSDGTWNIYVADAQGTPLSEVVPLSYAADSNQWVWDFIIFRKVG